MDFIMVLVGFVIAITITVTVIVAMFDDLHQTIDCDYIQGSNYNTTLTRSERQTIGYQTEITINGAQRHGDQPPDTGWAKACFEHKLETQNTTVLLSVVTIAIVMVSLVITIRLFY